MSGNSSEDEAMDGLNIKPPQHARHHKDRKRDRSHRHSKPRKEIQVPIEDDRRQQHHRDRHHRREQEQQLLQPQQQQVRSHHSGNRGDRVERDRYVSQQQQVPSQKQLQQHHQQDKEGHRSRSRKQNVLDRLGEIAIDSSGGGGERTSSSSRRHQQHNKSTSRSTSRRNLEGEERPERVEKVSDGGRDKWSQELLEAKLKRRNIELENARVLRDIERRREKERVGEESSERGTKRRRGHRENFDGDKDKRQRQRKSPSQSPEPERTSEGDKLETDELKEHVHLEIEDIENSSSELEEGEERSPSPDRNAPEIPQGIESGQSDVSSASDNENEQPQGREDAKATSDVSSSTSSSRKSRSNVSISSSQSSSEDESESDHDNEKANGDGNDGPKVGKVPRKEPNSPVSDDKMEEDKDEDPEEMKPEANSKDTIPTVIITNDDKDDEFDLLPPYLPALQGCRRVEEFQLLNRIEEGTYGVVYRAKDKRKEEIVALKRLKMEKEKDGFPITSLREINTLLKAQHENIVTVREIVVGSNTDKIFVVMDYVEHDLKALMETLKQKNQVFLIEEVKCLMLQLLRALAHLHDNWILHRDLKTSNLLLSHKGILKVGDFGLAREYGSPLKSYTPIVVTLWYRAPELLLGTKEYSTPIDVWSVGCIFGELLKMEPMFPGKSEANQLNLIFQSLGTPNDRIWPGYTQMPLLQKMTFADYPVNKLKTKFPHLSENGIDLMNKFLTFNPAKRITAEEALEHKFFDEAPHSIHPSMFPTWPAKSEMGHRKAPASPKPPSGGQQFKGLKEDDDSSGFFLGGGDARRQPVGAGFSLKF